MLQPFFDMIERLVSEFSWRRLIVISVVFGFISFLILVFEWYTAHFELTRLENSINLLSKLQELHKDITIQQDAHLKSIYNNLLENLDEVVSREPMGAVFGPDIWKPVMGAMPWLLLALVFVPKLWKRETDARSGLLGSLVLAVIAGGIGFALPTFELWWINYIVYPMLAFVFVLIFITLWVGKDKSTNS